MRLRISLVLLASSLIACSTQPSVPAPADPLPAMFPVSASYPDSVAGFAKIDEQVAANPFEGRLISYQSASFPDLIVTARVFLAGAFVSDQAAVDRVFAGARRDLGAAAVLQSEQRERIADAKPIRIGRSARFVVTDAAGVTLQLKLASYFADPYAVLLQSSFPNEREAKYSPLVNAFAAVWVAALQSDPLILCGAPEVVLVREGLSNVSTNGRVIFLSTETDNIDDQTIAELTRASTQARSRHGCSATDADFAAVEAAMRKRSRTR